MFKKISHTLVTGLALVSLSAQACDPEGKTGFMPENDMYIPVGSKSLNGISKVEFDEVLENLQNTYEPIVAQRGGKLKFYGMWNDGSVNAYTKRNDKKWEVYMLGGLARTSIMDKDAFSLVACHELGHHLGGGPRKKWRWLFKTWATNEGQADYWASSKCFRRLFEADDNVEIVKRLSINPIAKKKCEKEWETDQEVALCKRLSVASQRLGLLLNNGNYVSFDIKDTSKVKRTYDGHPRGQCRLDTYFAGALCTKDLTEETKSWSKRRGNCNRRDGYKESARPLCWFKP